MGIGDWGLGVWVWGQFAIHNDQVPVLHPQLKIFTIYKLK